MAHDHRSERPARRGRLDDSGGDTEGGKKLYYHLTLLAENETGLPQPDPARQPGVPRGLLLQAADGLGAAREVPRRPDRHHRLPRRARAAGAAAGRREGRAREGRPAAGDLRQGQPVRRAAGPRPAGAARHQPEADRDRPPDRRAAARHQRLALHPPRGPRGARRAAVRADRGDALATRSASSSRARSTTSRPPTRCATCSASSPRRATTRCGSPSGPSSTSSSARRCCPTSRSPQGFADDASTSTTSRGRVPRERWGDELPASGRRADRLRAQGHQRHGVRVLLPHRLGPHQARPGRRHPGRARPWLGGRVRGRRTACGSPTSTRSSTTCCSSAS